MAKQRTHKKVKYQRYAAEGRRERNKERRIDTIARHVARRAAKRIAA